MAADSNVFSPPEPIMPQMTLPTSDPADPQGSAIEQELAKINQEIYQRNAELALRNRTLSVLSKIYQIINTSLGVEETAQKLIDAVVSELGFLKSFIALIDPQNGTLKIIAVSASKDKQDKRIIEADDILKKLAIPMNADDNMCIKSLNQRARRLTNSLHDVLTPVVDPATAARIQDTFSIKTMLIDPITFAGDSLGVLGIGIGKHIGYLSKAEFETLRGIIDVVGIAVERAQIYKDLKGANEKLKEMDHLKDEFVSVASHELRTPMTAIRSYLWMVLEGKGGVVPEKQRFYLSRAYTSTTRLIRLVNDMLNVSRIESGRVTIDLKKVNLQTLAEEAIAEVMPRATELGIHIVLKKDPALPEVTADTDKIKEVIINLVGNSLKFTSKGGYITVSFEVKDGMVVTHVTDTGVGITPEDMSKLFQKFAMLKESYRVTEQASQGTGLGLYICKSIIEIHGGRIWVESEGRDKGSTFSFSLKPYNESDYKIMQAKFKGKGEVGIIHTQV